MLKNIVKSQSGLAALLIIVIIGAMALIMVKSASLLGIGEVNMAYTFEKGGETLIMTEGCAEETLRRFQLNSDYTASDFSLPIGNGQCTINTTADGDQRTITVLGNVADYYKKIQATATFNNGQITIDSWQELSD
jgi:hypothetical protein